MPSANGSQQNLQTVPLPNSVGTTQLQNSAVTNAILASASVSLSDMQAGAVSGNVIAANSILAGHVANNIISNNMLQSASISGNAIANQSINVSHINPAVFSANRNLIINGNMNIWQRLSGNSMGFTHGVSAGCDRFYLWQGTVGERNPQQDLGIVPPNSLYSLKRYTASSVTSGGSVTKYVVEGYDYLQAQNQNLTLSFYVYSNVLGKYHVAFANADVATRNYVAEYQVTQINTWQKITITFPWDTGGTWNYNNLAGLIIYWSLGCTNDTLSAAPQINTWLVPRINFNYYCTTSGVPWNLTPNAYFYMGQVQLEIGSQATPFEFIPYQQDLARCQRYFEIAGTGANGYWQNATRADIGIQFKQTKRTTTPTVGLVTGGTVSIDSAAAAVNVATTPSVSLLYSSANSVAIACSAASYSNGGSTAAHTAISQLDSWTFDSDF